MSKLFLTAEAQALVDRVTALEERVFAAQTKLQEELWSIEQASKAIDKELSGKLQRERERLAQDRAAFDALASNRFDGVELIAEAWADYEIARAEADATFLRIKSHSAPKAAEQVKQLGKQLAEWRRKARLNEWIVRLYESHAPWLAELRDFEEAHGYTQGETVAEVSDSNTDPVLKWLSVEEYRALSSAERNQQALERYLKASKSNWQIGRDYERYIGYLREQAGFSVTYHGIVHGLDDLGRDLIARRGNEVEVIQCKCWSRSKRIHEKHVFQLFGTVIAARIDFPDCEVRGTFVTTTSLSDRAGMFADQLEVRVEDGVPLSNYPRIKCNVARGSGERIYHLPFDQQYDSVVIEPDRGEFYALTALEAEEKGFRRAFNWRPSND